MNNTLALYPSTEITTSFLSASCTNDANLYNSLKADPIGTILSLTSIDFSSLDISVVENTKSDCALVLPYYESTAHIMSEILAEEDLQNVAGGEIGGSILAFFGFIGAAIGIGTVTTGTFYASVGAVAATTFTVTTYSTSAIAAGVVASIAVGVAGAVAVTAGAAGIGVLTDGLVKHNQGK